MDLTDNQKKFLDALSENLGIISKAAHACGMHRNSHVKWMKDSETYAREFERVQEDCIDVVENALMEKIIRDGDTTSIIFFLKCKGKKRGYIERQEIDATIIEKREVFKIGGKEYEL